MSAEVTEGLLILFGIVAVLGGTAAMAKFSAKLREVGFPGVLNFGLTTCMVLAFVMLLSSVMTFFDPYHPLSTLPFWPDSWLKGH